jgi:beta-glucanase (GH16 family)
MKSITSLLFNSVTLTFLLIFNIGCKHGAESGVSSRIPVPPIAGDFEYIPELSDEFNGAGLDTSKWFPNNPTWLGRQPAFFSEKNVDQGDGRLTLSMKKEDPPEDLKQKGYHTLSTCAVRSKHTVKYGYFEIMSKAMNAKVSSGFWFYNDLADLWTEIDVFEICGTGERENQYNMAVHVFRTPLKEEHWSKGEEWRAPYRFADDFHVFGLEWTPYVIRWYVDGAAVRTEENTYWHQPLTMNFDVETQPGWFGLPDESELSGTFSIEYVRAWRYRSADWKDEGQWAKINADSRH